MKSFAECVSGDVIRKARKRATRRILQQSGKNWQKKLKIEFENTKTYWVEEPDMGYRESSVAKEMSSTEITDYTSDGGKLYKKSKGHIGDLILIPKDEIRKDPTKTERAEIIMEASKTANKGKEGWELFVQTVDELTHDDHPGEWDAYIGSISRRVFQKNKRYDEVVKEEDRVGSYGRLSINGKLEVEEERSWEDVEKDLKSAEIKALFYQVKQRAKDLNVSKTGWWKKY